MKFALAACLLGAINATTAAQITSADDIAKKITEMIIQEELDTKTLDAKKTDLLSQLSEVNAQIASFTDAVVKPELTAEEKKVADAKIAEELKKK